MAGSWTMVNRNPYLSGSQKLVQARMYAQGGTLAALLTSFAIEGADAAKGKGRWETIKVLDPNDPTHQHIIEKKIHHERYAGEDQWRGTFPSSFDCYSCALDMSVMPDNIHLRVRLSIVANFELQRWSRLKRSA